jgi:hypothetical protein
MNYSVIGRKKLIFAEFPPDNMDVRCFFVEAIDDFDVGDEITEIAHPYVRKIVEYACQLAELSISDETLSDRWMMRWKDSVKTIALAAFPRSQGQVFVEDFIG